MVDVIPYSERWAEQFAEIAHPLFGVLEGIPEVRIEHVGSTSIPGLAAKPIIDIDIIVATRDMEAAVEALEVRGYQSLGENGIAGRIALDNANAHPAHNLYVCEKDGLAARNHLALRDLLRRSPEAREVYAAKKLELAADPSLPLEQYARGKSDVVRALLARTGEFTEAELGDIFRANTD